MSEDRLDDKVGRLYGQVGEARGRLNRVEANANMLDQRITLLAKGVDDIESRIEARLEALEADPTPTGTPTDTPADTPTPEPKVAATVEWVSVGSEARYLNTLYYATGLKDGDRLILLSEHEAVVRRLREDLAATCRAASDASKTAHRYTDEITRLKAENERLEEERSTWKERWESACMDLNEARGETEKLREYWDRVGRERAATITRLKAERDAYADPGNWRVRTYHPSKPHPDTCEYIGPTPSDRTEGESAALVEATDPMTYDITPADLDMDPRLPTPTARELWESEGTSLPDLARQYHRSGHGGLNYVVQVYGFSRNGSRRPGEVNTWTEGPCLKCRAITSRIEISDEYLCPPCAAGQTTGSYHRHRWGTEPDPGHRDWLALERIAHRCRMRDEARQRRLKRLRTHLPDEDDRYHDTRDQR